MVDWNDIIIACIAASPGWFAAYRLLSQSRTEALTKTAEQILEPYRLKIDDLKCEVSDLKRQLVSEQEKRKMLEDGDLIDLRREIDGLKQRIKNG